MTETAKTLKEATRKQKVEFIYYKINQNKKENEKRIPRKLIYNYNNAKIDDICRTYQEEFKDFIKNPPIKYSKFLADVKDKDGKVYFYEGSFENINDFENYLTINEKVHEIMTLAPAKGHHRCRYCNYIVKGSPKNILCKECQDKFGKQYYTDL